MNQKFLDAWGRWILGGMLSTIIALILLQWSALDTRLAAIETWRESHSVIEATEATQLAVVRANQEQVLRQLEETSTKLDELLRLYYTHFKDERR